MRFSVDAYLQHRYYREMDGTPMNRMYQLNNTLKQTFLCIYCGISLLWSAYADDPVVTNTVPQILVINSYHPGFAWSDGEMQGILETIQTYNERIPIHVEHLDTKRHDNYDLLDQYAETMKLKYAHTPLSIVIVSDNNALDFILEHRKSIAPDAPIVFCGINGFTPDMLQGQTNVLGVVESSDPSSTLKIAKKLCPWIKKVFVVHDYTPTGLANRNAFQHLSKTEFPDLEFEYTPNVPIDTLMAHIRQLDENTVVFQGIFIVDSAGQLFELEEVSKLLAENSSVPVFPLNETMFDAGGIGGALNSPYMEGKTAAELAISILNGTPITALPLAQESPLRLMFNYDELERFNLDEAELPAGSTIINRPPTLYNEYPELILGTIVMILAFLTLILFLLRNIIKRRRVEHELSRHQQHLEQLVVERTRKLEKAHDRLEQRARDLKRANEYKSQFLAHISHEVRTPLNAIIGFAEIILYSRSIDFIHQQSRIILNETEHLLSIINQLLDHAKMESGKFDLESKPFDLPQLIQSIHKSLRHHAQRKSITFEYHIPATLSQYVIGDPLRLRQILLNLLTNAIKFTREGFVRLTIDSPFSNDTSTTLRFSVSDSGIGIPAKKLDNIFHQFSQVDQSTTRKFGGTGLGTTIAYGLVELMGGKLNVSSTENEGSTFWFELNFPVPQDVTPEQLATLSPVSVSINNNDDIIREAHILVADDYASNQSVVRIHLQNAGYTCSIAENGAEAVKACEKENFDLVLMDISMPILDGYEATRQIRASGNANAKIPILALSAHAGDHVRQQCIESGMNDIIIKPIHRSSFIQQIDHWLTLNELSVTPPRPRQNAHENRPGSDAEPMDYQLAIHEFAGQEAVVIESLQHFVNDTRRLLPTMKIACQDLDPDYIMREAHKIAGAAGNLRAASLASACKQLEELCMNGQPNPGEVMNFLSRVIDRFDDLMQYLKEKKILD